MVAELVLPHVCTYVGNVSPFKSNICVLDPHHTDNELFLRCNLKSVAPSPSRLLATLLAMQKCDEVSSPSK